MATSKSKKAKPEPSSRVEEEPLIIHDPENFEISTETRRALIRIFLELYLAQEEG